MAEPVEVFKSGTVQASVFLNKVKTKEGDEIEIPTISFRVRYKDKKTGEWKSTNSLDERQIPQAIEVLEKSREFLKKLKSQKKEETPE